MTSAMRAALSGQVRKFVGGSDPGGWVVEVELGGAVQGVFGGTGEGAGGQDRVFVVLMAGPVDREAPAGSGSAVAQPHQRQRVAVGELPSDVGEGAAEADGDGGQLRPVLAGVGRKPLLQRGFRRCGWG